MEREGTIPFALYWFSVVEIKSRNEKFVLISRSKTLGRKIDASARELQ